jgi:hypothetical protein
MSNKAPTKLQVKQITNIPRKGVPLPKVARKRIIASAIALLTSCIPGKLPMRDRENKQTPTRNKGATKLKIIVSSSERRKLVKIVIFGQAP